MSRIMGRRRKKNWMRQPIKRANGKCITIKPETEAADKSEPKAAVKKRTKAAIASTAHVKPYYQRQPKPLPIKVKVICHICGATISNQSQLEDHIQNAHTSHKRANIKRPTRNVAAKKKRPDNQQLKTHPFYEQETVKCEICGVSVPKHMARHLRRVHGKEHIPEAVRPQTTQIRLSKKKLKSADISSNSTRRRPNTWGNIILISQRGTRVENRWCAECGVREKLLWEYAKSNHGAVCICGRCKPKVFDRSFKTVDALDIASRGGGFETNRRRH